MDALDTDLLWTFVAFADSGSLARAAEAVGRSPSAVTAQMHRLQAQVGAALLEASGRGRALTPAGEDLLVHARRILAAHRDALLSLKGAQADGRVALGSTQDFADSSTLPDLLRTFSKTHPRIRLDLRIGRSHELTAAFDRGLIDVALTMRAGPLKDERAVLREPMVWLCANGFRAGEELPLALLDPPCGFRNAVVAALDAAGRRYRIAATSPSLAGLRAAIRAGIAITARTRRSLEPGIRLAPRHLALPRLPAAEFGLRVRDGAPRAAHDLAGLLADELHLPAERK